MQRKKNAEVRSQSVEAQNIAVGSEVQGSEFREVPKCLVPKCRKSQFTTRNQKLETQNFEL